MQDKVNRFKELIENSSAGNKLKDNQLLAFKDELRSARLKGFTYLQIASFLKEVGLTVSKTTVRTFCIENLGEKPNRRSSKPKEPKRSTRKTPSNCVNVLAPGEPQPGFRVAGDTF